MTTASPATSADGFHATRTAQRADELVRALFEAVNADDSDATDAVLSRSLLSYEVHGMRTRTGESPRTGRQSTGSACTSSSGCSPTTSATCE